MILCRYIYAYSMFEANMLCNHDQSIEFELHIYIYINISYTCLMCFLSTWCLIHLHVNVVPYVFIKYIYIYVLKRDVYIYILYTYDVIHLNVCIYAGL